MKTMLVVLLFSGLAMGQSRVTSDNGPHPVGYMTKQDTSFTVQWQGKTYTYTGYQNAMNAMGWWTNYVDPWMLYDTTFNMKQAPASNLKHAETVREQIEHTYHFPMR